MGVLSLAMDGVSMGTEDIIVGDPMGYAITGYGHGRCRLPSDALCKEDSICLYGHRGDCLLKGFTPHHLKALHARFYMPGFTCQALHARCYMPAPRLFARPVIDVQAENACMLF